MSELFKKLMNAVTPKKESYKLFSHFVGTDVYVDPSGRELTKAQFDNLAHKKNVQHIDLWPYGRKEQMIVMDVHIMVEELIKE